MNELIESLGNNVKTLTYGTVTKKWTITYVNGINPDSVNSEDLIDFLKNA